MHRGTRTEHRARRRRRSLLVACLLTLLALGAGGCGGDSGRDDAAAAARERAQAALHAREMAAGRRVFARHCQACHTIAGKRYTGPIIEFEAPNLDEVQMKRSYVEWRVEYGGPAMATFSREMTAPELRALISYVTDTAGGSVEDDGDQPADELAAGKEVFAEHCAGCHAIEGRAATGTPAYPGNDFTLEKPSERFVMERVKHGVLVEADGSIMPSFARVLDDAQIRAVATYVTAVAGEGPRAPRSPFESP